MVAITAKTLFIAVLGAALSTQVACHPEDGRTSGREGSVRHRTKKDASRGRESTVENPSHRAPHAGTTVDRRSFASNSGLWEREFGSEEMTALERRLLIGAAMSIGRKVLGKVAGHVVSSGINNNNNQQRRSLEDDLLGELLRRELARYDELD